MSLLTLWNSSFSSAAIFFINPENVSKFPAKLPWKKIGRHSLRPLASVFVPPPPPNLMRWTESVASFLPQQEVFMSLEANIWERPEEPERCWFRTVLEGVQAENTHICATVLVGSLC